MDKEYEKHLEEVAESMMRRLRAIVRDSADILHEPLREELMQKFREKMSADSDFSNITKN